MTHTIVGHFPSHTEAERAVLELQKAGFDICWVSDIFLGDLPIELDFNNVLKMDKNNET